MVLGFTSMENVIQFIYKEEMYIKDTNAKDGGCLLGRYALVLNGLDKGKVGTITHYKKDDAYEYVIDGHFHTREEFSVVTKIQSDVYEKPKYKVGDKVVFTYDEDSTKEYIGYYVDNDGEDDICELDHSNFMPDAWMTTRYGLPLATGMYSYCTVIRKVEEEQKSNQIGATSTTAEYAIGYTDCYINAGGIVTYKKPPANGFYDYYKKCNYITGNSVPLWNASHEDIIKSNYIKYKDMNLIDKIRVNVKGKPMKALIKNEVLTLDERLTNIGKELFNDFLYAKFKDEFIADLAPKLEGLNEDK